MAIKIKRRRRGDQPTVFATVCATTGAMQAVSVSPSVARRYLDLHAILPHDLMSWSDEALDELIEDLDPHDVDACERVLILLAHHRSQTACVLLRELFDTLPEDLRAFAELAYAESLGWLGFDYMRAQEGGEAQIRHTSSRRRQ